MSPYALAEAAPEAVPGFDSAEHRFGLALGYAWVARTGVRTPVVRADYTFAWQGFGVGAGLVVDLQQDGLGVPEFILADVNLRRNLLLGDGRLWGAAELVILRASRGEFGDPKVSLYHGTALGAELGYEFGRTRSRRPFASVRVDLPVYTTEIETLSLAPQQGPDSGATLIDYQRVWTPAYTLWIGIAL